MSGMRKEFFKPFADVRALGQMDTIAKRMMAYGIGPQELAAMVEAEIAERFPQGVPERQQAHREKRCPACGSRMRVEQVNTSRCNAVGGGWTHIEICNNGRCPHTELVRR